MKAFFRFCAAAVAVATLCSFAACNTASPATATTPTITTTQTVSLTTEVTTTSAILSAEPTTTATVPPQTVLTTVQTTTVTTPATTTATTPATTTVPTTEATTTTIDLYDMVIEPPTDTNAAEPLAIKTYDGYNQPCHPKVLYFEEGWNGYRYWMAYTPYPYCEDSLENPCLAVSDDGYTWFAPDGVKNPVTGYPPTFENSAHYSDPHLLMNGETMELWFRYNPSYDDGVNADSNEGIILRICSTDGIHWSDAEQLYQSRADRDPVLSPIVELIDGVYTMWYAKRDGCLYKTTSADAHTWTPLEKTDLHAPDGRIWHQDMIRTELGYEIVFCARPAGAKSNLHDLSLYYAASEDGVHFTEPVLIVAPRKGTDAYDNASIYRASIVKADGLYRIYYSSMSERYIWKISLCEGESISSLKGMGRE